MPKRTDIESILIIGAGPIVIGQACEFDYSGTQACKALKGEGYRIVLVNSNPATIMTDPAMADATYIEPITPEIVGQIIEAERPDALLPTMGGQTALNVASALAASGTLTQFGVEMIGADREAIRKALFDEDLGPPVGTPMSATEAQARLAMINRRIGSPVGRLQHEFLQPVVRRVLHILKRRGDIEIPRVNGKEVQIVPVSPLARARQQEGVVQFDRFMELLTMRFGPQVANALVDQNKAATDIARRMGVDERLIRSPAEVEDLARRIQALSQLAPALGGDTGGAPGAAAPPQEAATA